MKNNNKIVLIEDDVSITSLITFKLMRSGFEVIHFPNGEGVINYLHDNETALILSDVMMPVMDGFALLKELKSNIRLAGIPVILISASTHESAIADGLNAGATDYITKPFSSDELMLRVKKAIKR